MRLPELLQAPGVLAWARDLTRALTGVLGTRAAAGIAVIPVELTTGTTTDVATPAARVRREVIAVARNSSALTAGVVALPISTDGTFRLLHGSGGAGRVVTCFIV